MMDNETEEQENNRIRNFLNKILSDDEELEDSFVDSYSSEEDVVERDSVEDTDDTDADPTFEPGDHIEMSPRHLPPPCHLLPRHHLLLPFRRLLQQSHLLTPHRLLLSFHHLLQIMILKRQLLIPALLFSNDIRAKNNHVWSTSPDTQTSKTPARNIVVSRRKVFGDARQAATPRECFIQLLDEDMVNKIVLHTNEQMDRVTANYYTQNNTTSYVNKEEMIAFLVCW
ncbi:hypothetical protein J6590_083999 [Homalodisca vitripennis]|nr:hypothetical protein J6590_083999 [Homalodisca vitripennis]